MDAPASESKLIDSFKMHVATIESANLEQLHALSVSVGWPLRSEDLQFLRDCGRGYVAHDDIGRLTGSAMWFPHGDDFATIGMVITSPRLQSNGTARWLMEHVLWDCCGRNLRTQCNEGLPPALSFARFPAHADHIPMPGHRPPGRLDRNDGAATGQATGRRGPCRRR